MLMLGVGGLAPAANAFARRIYCYQLPMALAIYNSQLSAMDVSVRSTMKGAAKCDKHCELQNSVNRQGLERILCFWDIPESMPASVSMLFRPSSNCLVLGMLLRVIVPHGVHFLLRHTLRYKIHQALVTISFTSSFASFDLSQQGLFFSTLRLASYMSQALKT